MARSPTTFASMKVKADYWNFSNTQIHFKQCCFVNAVHTYFAAILVGSFQRTSEHEPAVASTCSCCSNFPITRWSRIAGLCKQPRFNVRFTSYSIMRKWKEILVCDRYSVVQPKIDSLNITRISATILYASTEYEQSGDRRGIIVKYLQIQNNTNSLGRLTSDFATTYLEKHI